MKRSKNNMHQNYKCFVIQNLLGDESKWSGPKNLNRMYESIAVQAKVWRLRDLPPPTWRSQRIEVTERKFMLILKNHL